jgi:hypothetical protein
MLAGIAVFIITGIVFWFCLPRDGQRARFVDTVWEPLVAIAFPAAAALGLAMALYGMLELLGAL